MLKIIALKLRRRNLQAFHNHNEPHNLFHFHKFLGRHPNVHTEEDEKKRVEKGKMG